MATEQIAPERWAAYFQEFTERYQGRPVTIQLLGRGSGDHTARDHRILLGITLEAKGSAAGTARILLGDSPENHISRQVSRVVAVWGRSGDHNAVPMLEIRGADDQTLILQVER